MIDLMPTPTIPKLRKRQGSAGAPGPRRENSMVYRYKRGQVMGKLTLLEPKGKGRWLTRCECGREGIREVGQNDCCRWCRPVKRMDRPAGDAIRITTSGPRRTRLTHEEKRLTIGYNTAYWNAKRKGLAFTLTREQYKELATKPCEYCGGKLPEKGSGLDRIACQIGYTLANCVPCCTVCNRVKGETFSFRDMKVLGSVVRTLLNAKPSPVQGAAS
jgi:hypothetical protein